MSWKETAKLWESFDALEEGLKVQLQSMDDTQKEEAFYTPLEFGTAGMRGIVGPGINRMNTYTVRQATEGLSRLIESYGEEAKKRGVAIAYYSRHFSPEFAMESARTLAYGISAMHGRGIGELLDAALDSLKKAEKTSGFLTPSHLRRV